MLKISLLESRLSIGIFPISEIMPAEIGDSCLDGVQHNFEIDRSVHFMSKLLAQPQAQISKRQRPIQEGTRGNSAIALSTAITSSMIRSVSQAASRRLNVGRSSTAR